jgi:hypothetical protein
LHDGALSDVTLSDGMLSDGIFTDNSVDSVVRHFSILSQHTPQQGKQQMRVAASVSLSQSSFDYFFASMRISHTSLATRATHPLRPLVTGYTVVINESSFF